MTRTSPTDTTNQPRFDTKMVRGSSGQSAPYGTRPVDAYIPDDYPTGALVRLSIPIPGLDRDLIDDYKIVRPYPEALPGVYIAGKLTMFRDRVHGSDWGVQKEVFEVPETLRQKVEKLPIGSFFMIYDIPGRNKPRFFLIDPTGTPFEVEPERSELYYAGTAFSVFDSKHLAGKLKVIR